MKIDVTQKILGLDGAPIAEDATLRKVCVEALWNPLKGDESAAADHKIKLATLAQKIHASDEVDLRAEEVSLIKERINKAYAAPFIVAGAYALLDPLAKEAA